MEMNFKMIKDSSLARKTTVYRAKAQLTVVRSPTLSTRAGRQFHTSNP